jgi:hypothetical protein
MTPPNRSRPSDPCAPPPEVDTANVLAFPVLFARLSGVTQAEKRPKERQVT